MKDLLRPDGVLIVTIDEHEVHHLGLLLEKLFPTYSRQVVTIVTNPKGTGKKNFARVDEYAFFCVPNIGRPLINGKPKYENASKSGRSAKPQTSLTFDEAENGLNEPEMKFEDEDEEEGLEDTIEENPYSSEFVPDNPEAWEHRHARRRGGESSYRFQRPNQFYPIYVDTNQRRVVKIGDPLPLEEEPSFDDVDGLKPIWPIDKEGHHRVWRLIGATMRSS